MNIFKKLNTKISESDFFKYLFSKSSDNKSTIRKKNKKNAILKILSDYLNRLGYESNAKIVHKLILISTGSLAGFLALLVLIISIINAVSLETTITFIFSICILFFAAFYFITILAIFMYFDIIMYQRTKQIEEYLPDFLQLVSANINAGMTIERAMWFAVKPKFGILAKEIEDVAKATIAGEELDKALLKFSVKYNSRLLKEAINLIVAGANSGGQMAELLNKISLNIKETQLMRKEISASVTTYSIFIGVATILAAPVLMALSTELLKIVQKITSSIHLENTVGVNSLFSFNFSADSIAIGSFQNFAVMVLLISSFFSAAIISTIKSGSVKDGLKLIPIFMVVSVLLYFFAFYILDMVLSGIMVG